MTNTRYIDNEARERFYHHGVLLAYGAAIACFALLACRSGMKERLQIGDLVQSKNSPVTMSGTDVLGYSELRFVQPEYEEIDFNLSARSLLQAVVGYALPKFIGRHFRSDIQKVHDNMHSATVDILDARLRNLDFNKTGFSLFQVPSIDEIDWSSDSSSERFQELVTPTLREYYPNATRFVFSIPVKRGAGLGLRLINMVHSDFHPDRKYAMEFYDEYPPDRELLQIYAGMQDTDRESLGGVLGLRAPAGMSTPVCDRPLAVVDISTVKKEDFKATSAHLSYFVRVVHVLSSFIGYRPEQEWYYYSYQKPDEVLLFHQYHSTRGMSNPHSAFKIPDCGEEYETRVSNEFRVAVFW